MSEDEKKLKLRFHGKIIDHLGIQMYQSPVAAIAELVANAWDADAEKVEITLPSRIDDNAEIVIEDDGIGMSFEECQECYLNVGWCRRGNNPDARSPEKERSILGRKGIGKFAGFGIAKIIRVETISKKTGERTIFELNLEDLRGGDYVNTDPTEISVIEYLDKDELRKDKHCTKIVLKSLNLKRRPSSTQFLKSMSRRFLLRQRAADFKIFVDRQPLPKSEALEGVEFIFPKDYKEEDKPPDLRINGEWGEEVLSNGKKIKWRICFFKSPIDEEELRGISVFCKGKLAQSPFLFLLTGGLGGQHGQEYISGQIEADYLDSLDEELIATERQRINWENENSTPLLEWGRERVQRLFKIWQGKRAEARKKQLEEKISGFADRLNNLGSSERKTVKSALTKIASISTLSDEQFMGLGRSILTAWESGRLKDLIHKISEEPEMDESRMLKYLTEADVLTALNMAEAIKTKVTAISELKERIKNRERENKLRDFIYERPWLISPEWEMFKKERSIKKLCDDIGAKLFSEDMKDKRVDLALSNGRDILIIEFMKPGLNIDRDHIHRFTDYIVELDTVIKGQTGSGFKGVEAGYLIADNIKQEASILAMIKEMEERKRYVMDWYFLLEKSKKRWEEFLEILKLHNPDDKRIQEL